MALKTKTRTAVYAKSDATVALDGGFPVRVQRGEAWASDDPLVEAKPHLFSAYPLVKTSPRGEYVALDD